MKWRKLFSIRFALLAVWALALIAIVIAVGPATVIDSYKTLTPQGIKDTIDSFGALSVVTFLIANLVRPLLFLPISPFTIAGGFMFGMWWGLLWAMVGSTGSAVLIFLLSRYMLHDLVTGSLKGRYPYVDKMLAGRGWSFMFFLRMIPLLPFDLVSCFRRGLRHKIPGLPHRHHPRGDPGRLRAGHARHVARQRWLALLLPGPGAGRPGLRGLRAGPALGGETPERTVAVTRVRGRMDTEKVHAQAIVRFAVAIVFITFP